MNVKPIYESSAVKVVAFAFELQEHLTKGELAVLKSCYDETTSYFPNLEEHSAVTFKIDTNGAAPVANESGLAALTFSKRKEGAKELEVVLHVRESAIIFQCFNYSTWPNVFGEAKSVFEDIIEQLGSEKLIKTVSLEYLDEFEVLEVESSWKQDLFNVESKYLQSYIFDLDGLWHSHSGYVVGETLHKINVECVEAAGINYLKLLTQHQDRDPNVHSLQECLDNSFSIFSDLHQSNIDVLTEILSIEMKSQIGLRS